MAERIGATPVRYPFSFVIAGDSGAWADPTADGIYRQLLRQTARLTPAPVFLAHLGDLAGPGRGSRVSPGSGGGPAGPGPLRRREPRPRRPGRAGGVGAGPRADELQLRLRPHPVRRH